ATQNNLGAALARLGEREGGAAGARHLGEAAAAYRRALEVRTRDHLSQQWAATQNNLGAALARLGEREGGAAGARHLVDAAAAFRGAPAGYTRANLTPERATPPDAPRPALIAL